MMGVLNIDKPAGITSHDVVNRVRKLAGIRQVGHGGTLDPFATGVLLVAVGPATRLLEYTKELQKTYRAIFTLGASSGTDDADGEITKTKNTQTKQITKTKITNALNQFIGKIEQVPPAYSAVKIDGKKLYELARAGKPTTAKPRQVTIYDIKLIRYDYPEVEVEVACSGGTYIRAIARDLGQKLGTGGYTKELRRTRIGAFGASEATALDSLTPENCSDYLLPAATLVSHLPRVEIPENTITDFRQGKRIPDIAPSEATGPLTVYTSQEELLGIGSMVNSELQPDKVLIV